MMTWPSATWTRKRIRLRRSSMRFILLRPSRTSPPTLPSQLPPTIKLNKTF